MRSLLPYTLLLAGCASPEIPIRHMPSLVEMSGCYVTDLIASTDFRDIACNARWSVNDLPLLIETSDPILRASLEVAVCDFNSKIGLELVTLDPRAGGARVEANHLDELDSKDRIGQALWNYEGWEISWAFFDIKKGLTEEKRRLVILHELGHLFALSHTEEECSLLSPSVTPECPEFSSEQADALFYLYRPSAIETSLCNF